MDTLLKIFYMAWFLLFAAVPVLYKSRRQSMLCFYDKMLWRYSARRLYSLVVFLLLIAFHFYYLAVFKSHYDVIPSTAIAYALCSHRLFERTVRFFQNQKALWTGMAAIIVFLFTPHFFPLGVTGGLLILAAVFYPSRLAMDKLGSEAWWDSYWENPKFVSEIYHTWDAMEGAKLDKRSFAKDDACRDTNTECDGGSAC